MLIPINRKLHNYFSPQIKIPKSVKYLKNVQFDVHFKDRDYMGTVIVGPVFIIYFYPCIQPVNSNTIFVTKIKNV